MEKKPTVRTQVRVIRIAPAGEEGGLIVRDNQMIGDVFDTLGYDPLDQPPLSLVAEWMTEEEVLALPEWDGF